MEYLKQLDIMSPKVDLLFKNNNNFKTLFGLMSTVSIVSLLLIIGLYLGRDVYMETNPTISLNTKNNKNSSSSLSNLKNCFFFQNTSNFNESLVSVYARLYIQNQMPLLINYNITDIDEYFPGYDTKTMNYIFYCMNLTDPQGNKIDKNISYTNIFNPMFKLLGDISVNYINFVTLNEFFDTSLKIEDSKIEAKKTLIHPINNKKAIFNKRKTSIWMNSISFESVDYIFNKKEIKGLSIDDYYDILPLNEDMDYADWNVAVMLQTQNQKIIRNYKTLLDLSTVFLLILKILTLITDIYRSLFWNYYVLKFSERYIEYEKNQGSDSLNSNSEVLVDSKDSASSIKVDRSPKLTFCGFIFLKYRTCRNRENEAMYQIYRKVLYTFRQMMDIDFITTTNIQFLNMKYHFLRQFNQNFEKSYKISSGEIFSSRIQELGKKNINIIKFLLKRKHNDFNEIKINK